MEVSRVEEAEHTVRAVEAAIRVYEFTEAGSSLKYYTRIPSGAMVWPGCTGKQYYRSGASKCLVGVGHQQLEDYRQGLHVINDETS